MIERRNYWDRNGRRVTERRINWVRFQSRITSALHYLILANLVVACVLLIGGDVKNAMLGLAGSAFFGLALLVSEWRRA